MTDEQNRPDVLRDLYVSRLIKGVEKIRWYHWSVYYLYRWVWDPILAGRPGMVKCMRDEMEAWLKIQESAERKTPKGKNDD